MRLAHLRGFATLHRKDGLLTLLIGLVVVGAVWHVMGLSKHDFRAPINFVIDTVWFSVVTKAMLDNGWVYAVSQLGAPFSFSPVLFPALTHFDWLIMKGMAFFFHDYGSLINAFFLLTIALSGMSAFIALRLLGIGRWVAALAGFLYGILPFAFERNTAHICLTYYTVPLICQLCVRLFDRERDTSWKTSVTWGTAACIMQGLNYIYFSFFAAMLLVATLVALLLMRYPRRSSGAAAVALCCLLVATALNLVPSVLAWQTYGKPRALQYKTAAQAEIYGLKIRHLVVPNIYNKVPGLDYWAEQDAAAQFPNENENRMARLGTFGAVAFLLVLLVACRRLLSRSRAANEAPSFDEDKRIGPVIVLTLICLLFGTVGGLGAVFNELIFSDIRAYNRISVFIAFFSFACLCMCLRGFLHTQRRSWLRGLVALGVAGLSAVSVYDQLLEGGPFKAQRAIDVKLFKTYGAFVEQLEAAFGGGARIYMLPVAPFPLDSGIEKMGIYEHARAYLASKKTTWSWPVFSDVQMSWAERVGATSGIDFVHALVYSGFNAVWIDTNGYKDQGLQLITLFEKAGATAIRTTDSISSIRVFDLRAVASAVRQADGAAAFDAHARSWTQPVAVYWESGAYAMEQRADGVGFRWLDKRSVLRIRNQDDAAKRVHLTGLLQSGLPGQLTFTIDDSVNSYPVVNAGSPFALDVDIQPRSARSISVFADVPKLDAPQDMRALYVNIQALEISIEDVKATAR